MGIEGIRHVIPVLSGKGGVGKSTLSCTLTVALAMRGFKVGILDIDLCGPSVPRIFNVQDEDVIQSSSGWLPTLVSVPSCSPIKIMSIGFLLKSKHDSVVWRGPKKSALIRQFFNDVDWGVLDYLIIDTPPGTADEHIVLAEFFAASKGLLLGALLVTTPQWVSLADVSKEIDFCRSTGLPILGLVENMNQFICPHCAHPCNLFGSQGGKILAERANVPFLASLPIDPKLSIIMEDSPLGKFIELLPKTDSFSKVDSIIDFFSSSASPN